MNSLPLEFRGSDHVRNPLSHPPRFHFSCATDSADPDRVGHRGLDGKPRKSVQRSVVGSHPFLQRRMNTVRSKRSCASARVEPGEGSQVFLGPGQSQDHYQGHLCMCRPGMSFPFRSLFLIVLVGTVSLAGPLIFPFPFQVSHDRRFPSSATIPAQSPNLHPHMGSRSPFLRSARKYHLQFAPGQHVVARNVQPYLDVPISTPTSSSFSYVLSTSSPVERSTGLVPGSCGSRLITAVDMGPEMERTNSAFESDYGLVHTVAVNAQLSSRFVALIGTEQNVLSRAACKTIFVSLLHLWERRRKPPSSCSNRSRWERTLVVSMYNDVGLAQAQQELIKDVSMPSN